MHVGPHHKHGREPHSHRRYSRAAIDQRQQQETDQERPVRAELIRDAGREERRTQRAIEALRPVKRHQPDDSAETREQRRAE